MLAGCGSPAESPIELVPEPVPADRPPVVETAEPTRAPLAVGWPGVPDEPTEPARAVNTRGLELHRRGDFVASEAAFAEAISASPTYVNAHFNHTCALVRLGRLDEADAALRELVLRDLPAVAGRLDTDTDLEALRNAASWRAFSVFRDEVAAAFAASLDAGVVVLRAPPDVVLDAGADDERVRRTIEVGVWLPATARFVPLAPPSVTETGAEGAGLELRAGFVDRARGAVVVVEASGTWSEGDAILGGVHAVSWGIGDGREIARLESGHPQWSAPVDVHATVDGLAARFWVEPESGDEPHVGSRASGAAGFDEEVRPSIVVAREAISILSARMPPPEGASLRRLDVTLAEGAPPIHLAGAHAGHHDDERGEWWAEDGGALYLLTAVLEPADGGSRPLHAALSRVDRAAGTAVLLAHAVEGIGTMVRAGDGSLYAQIGDRVLRLRGADPPEELPAGIRLLVDAPGSYGTAPGP